MLVIRVSVIRTTALLLCGVLWAHGRRERYDDFHATRAKPVSLEVLSDLPGAEGLYFEPNSKVHKYSDHEEQGDSSISSGTDSSKKGSSSSDASSVSTRERTLRKRKNRVCTPCPGDMVMKHSGVNVHWICGKYQRARRSFKSICMLRYRNCEDGTMFVKVGEGKCQEDPDNGRSWFYVYKT